MPSLGYCGSSTNCGLCRDVGKMTRTDTLPIVQRDRREEDGGMGGDEGAKRWGEGNSLAKSRPDGTCFELYCDRGERG